MSRHFQRDLLPAAASLKPAPLVQSIANHLRFKRPGPDDAWSYNPLQRLAYLGVIFVLVPLMVWT
jgi:thiosulfate reductase cytochrome b subunit